MRTNFRRESVLTLLILAALSACSDSSAPDAPPPNKVEAALARAGNAAGALAPQLMGALGEALGAGGPVKALEVCQVRAPQIASSLGAEQQLEIGRTALRVRNPANAADEWERGVLANFVQRLTAGADANSLEAHSVEAQDGGWRVRWMRGIVLQPLCATCHGDELAPDLREELARRYPEDQATGFKPGELRGAFTASVTIPRG